MTEMKLKCRVHGESKAHFVCKHLLRDKGVGFVQDPTGDCAWCYECEEAYDEWTLVTAEQAGLAPVCAGCFETIRKLREAS